MGSKKIEIKPKKTLIERKAVYSNRKQGILKKAKELSVLCDVPLMLLFFSPADKTSYEIFVGEHCNFEEVLRLYAAVPPGERSRRKFKTFEELIKKSSAEQGGCHSGQTKLGNMQNELSVLKSEIKRYQKALGPLSYLDNIYRIDDVDLLEEMGNVLQNLISHNSTFEGNFLKQFCETSKISQESYPRQFETLRVFQENYPGHFNDDSHDHQVTHQPQTLSIHQVPNNVSGPSEVITEKGSSCYSSLNRPVELPISTKEERAESSSRYGYGFTLEDFMKPF